jgi:hypothetical protein
MKKHSITLLAVLVLVATAFGQDKPLPPVTQTYALTNAHIIIRPGEVIEKGTIVVKDGLIHSVGKTVDIPYDAKVIEADSMYIYAGFIDGLSHAGIKAEQEEESRNGRGRRPDVDDPGNPPNDIAGIQPHRKTSEMLNVKERSIGELRQLGFTTAHVVPEDGMLPGYGAIVLLAGDSPNEMVLRDKSALFSQLDGAPRVYPATVIGVMSKWRELYKQAEQAKAHEAMYAEDPKGVKRPAYDPVLHAFYPVLEGELPVVFHVEDVLSAYRVYSLQQELDFPLVLAGLRTGWHLTDRIREKGTPVFLALELPDVPDGKKEEKAKEKEEGEEAAEPRETLDPEIQKLEARRAEVMKQYESQAATFAKKSLPFGFASAGAKGSDIRPNLRRMIEAGLSEDAALAALTTTPAKMLGLDNRLGTVEAGKIANLVVTDKPYFDEKSNVRYVFVDGKVFEYAKGGPKKAADPKAVANVAGRWNYKIDVPGQSMGGTLNLVDNGGLLEGTVSNPQTQDNSTLENVVIDGSNLRFLTRFDGGGQMITAEWSMEVSGDTFEGSVSVGSFGTFDIEGERLGPPEGE